MSLRLVIVKCEVLEESPVVDRCWKRGQWRLVLGSGACTKRGALAAPVILAINAERHSRVGELWLEADGEPCEGIENAIADVGVV